MTAAAAALAPTWQGPVGVGFPGVIKGGEAIKEGVVISAEVRGDLASVLECIVRAAGLCVETGSAATVAAALVA